MFKKNSADSFKKKSYSGSSYIESYNSTFNFLQSNQSFIKYYIETCPLYTALDLIGDNISTITPVLYDTKTKEYITDHPLLDLLSKPNPFISSKLFLKDIVSSYILTGNAYIDAVGPINRDPLRLINFASESVNIEAAKDGFAGKYTYNSGNSNSLEFTRDEKNKFVTKAQDNEILQIRTYNPLYNSSNLKGLSKVSACQLELSQYLQASIHNNALLSNGARPSGLLTNNGESLNDEQQLEIMEYLQSTKTGPTNAGKIMAIFGANVEWKQMSESIKDMDFVELKKQTTIAVYNALKIPLPMVSPDHMSLANMDTAKLSFYDNCVLPLASEIFSSIGNFLLPRYGKSSSNLKLTYDESAIGALRPRRIDNATRLSLTGILTTNELRSELGKEAAEGEGVDELYQPMNLVPVGTDIFTEDNRKVPRPRKHSLRAVELEYAERKLREVRNSKGDCYYSEEEIQKHLDSY